MLQLIYKSHPIGDPWTVALDIVRVSERNNHAARVSGILFFASKIYLQFLEGPDAKIRAIGSSIAGDSRHAIAWMGIAEIRGLSFSRNLPLGYVNVGDIDRVSADPVEYTRPASFGKSEMDEALRFLQRIGNQNYPSMSLTAPLGRALALKDTGVRTMRHT